MKKSDPYAFQKRDVKKILEAFAAGHRRVLYALPTGGGKTHVAGQVADVFLKQAKHVVWTCHRREHVEQTTRVMRRIAKKLRIDVILALAEKLRDAGAPMHVCGIDTLSRRIKPPAQFGVCDEAHHSVSEKYRIVFEMYPEARWLGVTATPYRFDGKGLDEAWDIIIEGPSVVELIAAGVLSPSRVFSHDNDGTSRRLKSVKTVRGDFDRKELSKAFNKPKLVGPYVDEYERLGNGKPAVVYAIDLKHAVTIKTAFERRGYVTGYIHGGTPKPERERLIDDFAKGRIQILINCEILTEGWDCPSAKVCIMARPTKSMALYRQMIGRFLRGRRTAIIIDHAGNALRHGLPTRPLEFTLEGGLKKGPKGQPLVKTCPECGAVVALGTRECECGHVFAAEADVEPANKKLVEVKVSEEEKAAALEAIRRVAKTRKASEEWVRKVYASRFGESACA